MTKQKPITPQELIDGVHKLRRALLPEILGEDVTQEQVYFAALADNIDEDRLGASHVLSSLACMLHDSPEHMEEFGMQVIHLCAIYSPAARAILDRTAKKYDLLRNNRN